MSDDDKLAKLRAELFHVAGRIECARREIAIARGRRYEASPEPSPFPPGDDDVLKAACELLFAARKLVNSVAAGNVDEDTLSQVLRASGLSLER